MSVRNAMPVKIGIFWLILLGVAPVACAIDMGSYSAEDMLLNLQQSLPALFKLATAGCYLLGIVMCFKGLYDLKQYGESRTMMSGQRDIKAPLFELMIGTLCIYSPTAFSTVMMSTFGYSSVLSYNDMSTSSGQPLSPSGEVILQMIQVMGVFAFVRGWVLLARSAGGAGQHGVFGKGLAHVFGGVFAINIVGTCNVIAATFGITF